MQRYIDSLYSTLYYNQHHLRYSVLVSVLLVR